MNKAVIDLLMIVGGDVRKAGKRMAQKFFDIDDLDRATRTASWAGVPLPKGRSTDGIIARCQDPNYWSRYMRPIGLRYREQRNRVSGYVRSTQAQYVSDPVFHIKLERNRSNRVLLEEDSYAISDYGDVENIATLADRTVSNPKNRRHELMTRIRGFEDYAKQVGHTYLFVTVTTPGEFHVAYADTGRMNPAYNGSTPIEAHQRLLEHWGPCRAALHDAGIAYYGMRVVEPHHDGTPHWHMILFCDPAQLEALKTILRDHLTRDNRNPERGVDFKDEDPTKGGATAYMSKYISKNIDGEGLGVDERSLAARVTIWKEVWGFDQFEQLGGPPVGVWRDLRKVKEIGKVPARMRSAWQAANDGDWCAYINAMGGPFCGSKYPIKPERGLKEGINGEVTPSENRYGEPLKTDRYDIRPVIGLRDGLAFLRTYAKFWTTIMGKKPESSAAEPERRSGAWTRDNNRRAGLGGFAFGQGPPIVQPPPMLASL